MSRPTPTPNLTVSLLLLRVSGHPGMGPMQRMVHPGGRMAGPMNPYDSLQNYSMGPRGPPPNTNMGPGPGGMPPMSMSVHTFALLLLYAQPPPTPRPRQETGGF